MSFDRFKCWGEIVVWAAVLACGLMNLGCSATPIGLAVSLAGEAVNDVDEQQRSKEFVGGPVSQADAKLGAPVDVLSDTRSSRQWRLYNVPMDPMNTSRYVLEVEGTRVLAVDKVQQYSDPVEYEGLLAVLRPKVMGKSPAECEANLKMGPPLLTVRSKATGQLIRLYDARVVKELQSPHYCVLRFGAANTCEKINLVKAYTSTGAGSAGK
jgi:hypothetical protein